MISVERVSLSLSSASHSVYFSRTSFSTRFFAPVNCTALSRYSIIGVTFHNTCARISRTERMKWIEYVAIHRFERQNQRQRENINFFIGGKIIDRARYRYIIEQRAWTKGYVSLLINFQRRTEIKSRDGTKNRLISSFFFSRVILRVPCYFVDFGGIPLSLRETRIHEHDE